MEADVYSEGILFVSSIFFFSFNELLLLFVAMLHDLQGVSSPTGD